MNVMTEPELKVIPVMVGTAGHVDHGKTALVKLLTGCDTDGLPEEKKRGMSIDLGFAPFLLEDGRMVGIIDVPGHEDFIRNMVAGASSVDVLVLVIAADDGIMPQTIEHLKIVSLLTTPQVMAVITKIDLVSSQRQLEMKETVKAFLAEFGYTDAPVIMVSNKTGEGLIDVRQAIERLVGLVQQGQARKAAFRMHIERAFSPPGVGTVVTGIPSSGCCAVGDKLEFFPGGKVTACRSIEKYGHDSGEAPAHTCCAITIKDIKVSEVERGMTLAAPGVYRETSSAIISVQNVHGTAQIKRRQEMRFCCGTDSVVVRGLLLGASALAPGEKGFMQIGSSNPMVVATGDRFLLRSLSPSATIGGGRVLTTHIDPRRKKVYLSQERLQHAQKAIEDNDPFFSELTCGAFTFIHEVDLPGLVQDNDGEVKRSVDKKVSQGVLTLLGPGCWVINDRIPELEQNLALLLTRYHQQNKTSSGMPVMEVCESLGLESNCLEGLRKIFETSLLVAVQKNFFLLKNFIPALSAKQQAMKDMIIKSVAQAEHGAVAAATLQEALSATTQDMQLLTRLLSEQGLVTMAGHYLIATAVMDDCLKKLEQLSRQEAIIELAMFRQATGMSRNLAVPILEVFDSRGITCREGKGRRLLRRGIQGIV